LEALNIIDIRQRAFRCADGVAENLFLLDALFRDARSTCGGLCIASLDLTKAFDSVSHEAITIAMHNAGLEPRFVEYIREMYQRAETFLQVAGKSTRVLKVTKGVRQGDPLSPFLFNLVVDQGLRKIPVEIGYRIGKAKVNALAFADDVILVAATPYGAEVGMRRVCRAIKLVRPETQPGQVCDPDHGTRREEECAEGNGRNLLLRGRADAGTRGEFLLAVSWDGFRG
jgi:hypothetical protein